MRNANLEIRGYDHASGGTAFRFRGTGDVIDEWYVSTSCTYQHSDPATGTCLCATDIPDVSGYTPCGDSHPNHWGLAQWGASTTDCLHSSHSGKGWYMRDGWGCANDCTGNQTGCDVELAIH